MHVHVLWHIVTLLTSLRVVLPDRVAQGCRVIQCDQRHLRVWQRCSQQRGLLILLIGVGSAKIISAVVSKTNESESSDGLLRRLVDA